MNPINRGKRLNILSEIEIKEIYQIPKFTNDQREFLFALDAKEMGALGTITATKSKIYFILQLGYFKVNAIFYNFTFDQVRADTAFVSIRYFPKKKTSVTGKIWRNNISDQRKIILSLLGYQPYSSKTKKTIESKVEKLMRIHSNQTDVFRELLSFLEIKKITTPLYSVIQDIFRIAHGTEQKRIQRILRHHITKDIKKEINQLLESENNIRSLTILKKQPKNFTLTELVKEAEKCQKYRGIYSFCKNFIPKLSISKHSIHYYADLTEYYSTYRLKNIKGNIYQLYLICYVYHRFRLISDNLVTLFTFHIEKFIAGNTAYSKQKFMEYKFEQNKNLPKVGQVLKLVSKKDIPKGTSFESVQKQAFDILPEDQFDSVSDYIIGKQFDSSAHEWQHISDSAMIIKRFMRPLVLNINFASNKSDHPVLVALSFLKMTIKNKKSLNQIDPSTFPDQFIPKSVKRYIRELKTVPIKSKNGTTRSKKIKGYHSDKYEFLIYRELKRHFDTGLIFCHDTTQYNSLKNDLVSDDIWKNKTEFLNSLDSPNININIEDRLVQLKSDYHEKIVRVNKRILNGENKWVKIKEVDGERKWHLVYPKQDIEFNNTFFDQLTPISIANLMLVVNDKTNFLSSFSHIKPRYAKQKASDDSLIAAITANAFNFGIRKMSERSNVDYFDLDSTNRNFLRLETLHNALDKVNNCIANLDIYKKWDVQPDLLMGAVDGQKYETRLHTLQSRYSQKYFGLKKGIVSYNLLVNHVPVNTKTFGANEHESGFVFDIVYNNTSNIDPIAISGDQHSANQLNFAILDAINKNFCPHYKNFSEKVTSSLCSFNHPDDYKDYIIKPAKRINESLFVEEWDEIQRIFASLLTQEVTQSVIVKKLSSHARNSKIKRGLWEYNNIFMSLFMLEYIDDPILRSNVRRVLNRIECYHQLRRAIARVGGEKFKGSSILENEICNLCATLVASCIILYNSLILTQLGEFYTEMDDADMVAFIYRLSPVAWKNVNLTGKYEFKSTEHKLSVADVIKKAIDEIIKK